jgi:hypothetical protein
MLTATPHSGDEAAFFRLLGLLDRDFEKLAEAAGDERDGCGSACRGTSCSVAAPTSPSGRRQPVSRAARPRS